MQLPQRPAAAPCHAGVRRTAFRCLFTFLQLSAFLSPFFHCPFTAASPHVGPAAVGAGHGRGRLADDHRRRETAGKVLAPGGSTAFRSHSNINVLIHPARGRRPVRRRTFTASGTSGSGLRPTFLQVSTRGLQLQSLWRIGTAAVTTNAAFSRKVKDPNAEG